jgi:hypothetical protein
MAYRRSFRKGGLWGRWLRVTTIFLTEKSLFNFYRDLIQPPACLAERRKSAKIALVWRFIWGIPAEVVSGQLDA